MAVIIGLGRDGTGIADGFKKYPEYQIYKIGTEVENHPANLTIDHHPDMQSYEENFDQASATKYLRGISKTDEVFFILAGDDPICGLTLMLLEVIRESNTTVIYIRPDRRTTSLLQRRDDRIVFGVLQEYARSGMVSRLMILEKSRVEDRVGDVSISDYEKSIHDFISYIIAMTNYFDHTDPVLTTRVAQDKLSRVGTYGILSIDQDSPTFFADITDEQYVHYYYGIPETSLNEDPGLMRRIRSQTKSLAKDGVDGCFSVYQTDVPDPLVLAVTYSKKIQSLPPVQ
jgi:hypothetical protein